MTTDDGRPAFAPSTSLRATAGKQTKDNGRKGRTRTLRGNGMALGAENPQRKRWRIPLWAKITIGAVIAYAALIAFPHVYFGMKIRAELKRIRAEGSPVSLWDADAFYPSPAPGQNAAGGMALAFSAFGPVGVDLPVVGEAKLPPRNQPMPEAMTQSAAKYLADNAKALDLLRTATAMKECRYPIQLSGGAGALLPHMGSMRLACRVLNLEAILAAQQRDTAKAADAVKTSLGVARTLSNEPLLISQLVRIACDAISLQALERALSLAPFSEGELEEIAGAIQSEEARLDEGWLRATQMERCANFAVFRDPGGVFYMTFMTGYQPSLSQRVAMQLYGAVGGLAADRWTFLRTMRSVIAVQSEPFPARLAAARAVEEEMKKMPPARMISRMLLPAFSRACAEEATAMALLSAARTATAVERYRLAKGALPEKLDDLVPKFIASIPSDPFDGKPLRYARRPVGYVVYSVGPNLKDDGGVERERRDYGASYGPSYDVTFTVER